MKLRAILLAGTVLPFTVAPASSFLLPQASAPGEIVLAQAEVSEERLAARARFEEARDRLAEARAALVGAEAAGQDAESAREALQEAEAELEEARSALVELLGPDGPQTASEQIAWEEERDRRAPAETAEAAEPEAEVPAEPEIADGSGAPADLQEEAAPAAPPAPPLETEAASEAGQQPEVELGLTREEHRQRREEKRAAAEGQAPEESAPRVAEQEPLPDTAETPEEPQSSLLDRFLGRTGEEQTEQEAETAPAPPVEDQADEPTGEMATAGEPGQPPEMEFGLTPEEHRREERARAEERPPADAAPPAAQEESVASAPEEPPKGLPEQAEGQPDIASQPQPQPIPPGERAAETETALEPGQMPEPEIELGLTREERRQRREERRAAAERGESPAQQEPSAQARGETEVGTDVSESSEAQPEAPVPREQAEAAEAERPSLAGRLFGRLFGDEQSAQAPETSAGEAEQAARQAPSGQQPVAETPEEVLPEVTAEELQERRRQRREARQEKAGDRDEVTLNQVFQNQTALDNSVRTETDIDQSTTTVTEQTVQQQQVIEQQRGPGVELQARADAPEESRLREERLRGELHATRRELERTREELREARLQRGDEVIRREADRIIVRRGGEILVLRADNEDRFGYVEDVQEFANGYTRTVAVRGPIRIVTLYDPQGAIVRRSRVLPDGREMVLIDAMQPRIEREREPPPVVPQAPRQEIVMETRRASTEDIERALAAPPAVEPPRAFTLEEVRYREEVRDLVPRVDLDTITFEFDSAEFPEDQLITLEKLGIAMEDLLFDNPNEVFLIEGHTDAPGSNVYNLALSDRRAETVAIALSQNFDVPPENLVTQGYGEEHLKIPTVERERQNRRVSIRRITRLVNAAGAQ